MSPYRDVDDNVWLYFIQGEEGGPINIASTIDPKRRLRDLQSGSPRELRILCQLEIRPAHARELSAILERARLRGTWYQPDEIVASALAAALEGHTALYKFIRRHAL